MKCKEFVEILNSNFENFQKNMENLEAPDQLLHEWMDMFLRWSEWKTDMHDPYWVEGWEEPVQYTTVAIDKYGRVYDLTKKHPSWEQAKKGNDTVNIVVDAFTWPVDKVDELRKK